MLRDTDAVATLAVKDLGVAAEFYEETLGLSRARAEDNEALVFESGDTTINVLPVQLCRHQQSHGPDLGGRRRRGCRPQAQGEGRQVRALRLAGHKSRGRRAHLRRHQGRLVQGSGRQHPQRGEPLRDAAGQRIGSMTGTALLVAMEDVPVDGPLQCCRLKNCTARSCFSAATRL